MLCPLAGRGWWKWYFNWINIVVIKRSSPSLSKHSTVAWALFDMMCMCVETRDCLTLLQSQGLSIFSESSGANELVPTARICQRDANIKSHRGLQWSLGWNCNWKMQWAVQHWPDARWDKTIKISPIQVQTSSPHASLKQIALIFNFPRSHAHLCNLMYLFKIISWKCLPPKKQHKTKSHAVFLQRKERYPLWSFIYCMLLPKLIFLFVLFVLLPFVVGECFNVLNIFQ